MYYKMYLKCEFMKLISIALVAVSINHSSSTIQNGRGCMRFNPAKLRIEISTFIFPWHISEPSQFFKMRSVTGPRLLLRCLKKTSLHPECKCQCFPVPYFSTHCLNLCEFLRLFIRNSY